MDPSDSKTLHLLALLALLVFAATLPVRAQAEATTGAVEGRLLDVENERPLAEATVRLAGPALPRERSLVTGADGRFQFPGLPPGVYRLAARREGWVTVEQSDIQVRLGQTVTLRFEVFTAFDDDEVLINTSAPVLDLTQAVTGAGLSSEEGEPLPTGRTFDTLPPWVPEVLPAPGPVPGGSSTAGAEGGASRTWLDGLEVTSPATGRAVVTLPLEMIEQVQVATGGLPAESDGGAGGVVRAVTRSGGESFHGRLFAFYRGDETAATPASVSGAAAPPPTSWDLGFAVGGAFPAGSLRGFASSAPAYSSQNHANRQGIAIREERRTVFSAARLTAQPAAAHLVSAGFFANPGEVRGDSLAAAAGLVADRGDTGGWGGHLEWSGTLTRRLFAEAGSGRLEERFEAHPAADVALYEDLTPGAWYARGADCGPAARLEPGIAFAAECRGGTLARSIGEGRRRQAHAAMGWRSGGPRVEHTLRWGGRWSRSEVSDDRRFPGPAPGPFLDSAGVVVDPAGLSGQRWELRDGEALLIELEGASVRQARQLAVFAEDRLHLGSDLVLRLGVRAESLTARLSRAPGVPETRLDLGLGDALAPRLAVIWDVRGTGQSKLYAAWGRYQDLPPPLAGETFGSRLRRLAVFDPPADGSLPTAADPGGLRSQTVLGRRLGVDPELAPPAVSELRVGYERELLPELTASVSAVRRELTETVEDVSVDGGETYWLTNPGGTFRVHPLTGEPLAEPVTFPRPRRDYQALVLALDKGFAGGWQLHGSWVVSETEGNYTEAPAGEPRLLASAVDTRFDFAELLAGAEGPLPEDRRHQVRVISSYRWASGLTTGAYARWLSGAPISRWGAHPLLGRRQRLIGSRGDAGRTPSLWSLDVHLELPVEVGGQTLQLIGDVLNLTDQRKAVWVDEEWTFTALGRTLDPTEVRTNPGFGEPLVTQPPRSLRLGVRLAW